MSFRTSKVLEVALAAGEPKQIVFGATTLDPTAANDLRLAAALRTSALLTLTDLANDAARQSAKVDLGAHRALQYAVRVAFEFAATPVAGETVTLYWAPSPSSTVGVANSGALSGADAAYTGYSANIPASVLQLQSIGTVTVTEDKTAIVQVSELPNLFSPRERWGSLLIVNYSDAAFHSDSVESHVVFDPIIPIAEPL